jgi:hypothetical protein
MTTNELLKKILALNGGRAVDVVPPDYKPLEHWGKQLGKARESARRSMKMAVKAGLVEVKVFVVMSGRRARHVQHFRAAKSSPQSQA